MKVLGFAMALCLSTALACGSDDLPASDDGSAEGSTTKTDGYVDVKMIDGSTMMDSTTMDAPDEAMMDAPDEAMDALDEADVFCPMPLLLCNNVCVDPKTDNNNCSNCGIACSMKEVCKNSQCDCKFGFQRCGLFGCVDLSSDNNNCGLCYSQCANNKKCTSGLCL
jgi:hypothetical protein